MDEKQTQIEQKKILRESMKALRNGLSKDEAALRSRVICSHVLKEHFYKEARLILAYYPLGNEVDVRPVLMHAFNSGKTVGLPKISSAGTMDFYEITGFDDLIPGPMKLMEPAPYCKKIDAAFKPALMIVPGLAFCLYEHSHDHTPTVGRMGYGGGFYDRWLESFYARCKASHMLITCGAAYDFQMIKAVALPKESHDQRLHSVITENGKEH